MALTTNVSRPTLQTTSYMQNGMSSDIEGVKFPLQFGVPIQNLYMFKVIPAADVVNCVSPSNPWVPSGQPLNQLNTGTAPNIISKAINSSNILGISTFNGVNGILFDCERCPSFTLSAPNAGPAQTVTATGFDYLGNAVITTVALPATGTSTQTEFIFPTPMSIVTSVVFPLDFSNGGAITCMVGNSNNIGLPYYLAETSFVQSCTWNGNAIANTSVVPGYDWRTTGVLSGSTGPARGYVPLPSDANNSFLLTCFYYVSGSDSELNAEMNNGNQSSLKLAQVRTNTTTGQNVLPYLTEYDLTGVVYPANTKFIYAYAQSLV